MNPRTLFWLGSMMAWLSLQAVGNAAIAADADSATRLEIIKIVMPRPPMNLDFSNPQQDTGATRHCITDAGTRLRRPGSGKCVVGSGMTIQAGDLKHRGFKDLSASANVIGNRNH